MLPGGAFVADLASLRVDFTISPRMTLRTLSQYNSTTSELSHSVRFNWIYSPGSDIYVAYDELRLDGDPSDAGPARPALVGGAEPAARRQDDLPALPVARPGGRVGSPRASGRFRSRT